jgi:hypothetical protein
VYVVQASAGGVQLLSVGTQVSVGQRPSMNLGEFALGGASGMIAGGGSLSFNLNAIAPGSWTTGVVRWELRDNGVFVPGWVSVSEGTLTAAPTSKELPSERVIGFAGMDEAGKELLAALRVRVRAAVPEITRQMEALVKAKLGEVVVLQPGVSVRTESTATRYEWRRTADKVLVTDGTANVVGTGATLQFAAAEARQGFYWLKVSNESGFVWSEPAEFVVAQRLEIKPSAIFASLGDTNRAFAAELVGIVVFYS